MRVAQSHKRQSHHDKLRETFYLTKQQITDTHDNGADRKQPTPAITVDELSYKRRD